MGPTHAGPVLALRRKAEVRALLSNAGLPLDRELDTYSVQESLNWGVRPPRPDWNAADVADRMALEMKTMVLRRTSSDGNFSSNPLRRQVIV